MLLNVIKLFTSYEFSAHRPPPVICMKKAPNVLVTLRPLSNYLLAYARRVFMSQLLSEITNTALT